LNVLIHSVTPCKDLSLYSCHVLNGSSIFFEQTITTTSNIPSFTNEDPLLSIETVTAVKRRSRNWPIECKRALVHEIRSGHRAHTCAGTHNNYVRLMVCVVFPFSIPNLSVPLGICRVQLNPDYLCLLYRMRSVLRNRRYDERARRFLIFDRLHRKLLPQAIPRANGVKKIDVQYRRKKALAIDVTRVYELLVLRRSLCFTFYMNLMRTHLSRPIPTIVSAFKNFANYFQARSVSAQLSFRLQSCV